MTVIRFCRVFGATGATMFAHDVLWLGAFFGLAACATYDLTSLALIRDFPLRIVLVDLAWGIVLTAAAASSAGYAVAR